MATTADPQRIANSALGQELEHGECQILANAMQVVHLSDREYATREKGSANTLFLLIEGKLAVSNEVNAGEDKTVYIMSPGECAGTRAFVDRTPRKASLQAVGSAVVYTLEPNTFEKLLDSHPKLVYKVMRALFRITHTNLMRMNQESQQLAAYINSPGRRA
ncbi:MAG: cyclic nucleotide-binding domain-containing protein [Gammaproteobacteria bacterium]|nr:cyclic nucleotide-binding domain-containing protein [Gammaproteobacteria bacterium]